MPRWFEKTSLQCSVKAFVAKYVMNFSKATEYFCSKSCKTRSKFSSCYYILVKLSTKENLLVTDTFSWVRLWVISF